MKELLQDHGHHMRLSMLQSIMTLCVVALLSISLMPAVSFAETDAPAANTEAAQTATTDTQQDSEAAADTAAPAADQEEENVAIPAIIGVGSILLLVYIVTHKFKGKKGKFSDED